MINTHPDQCLHHLCSMYFLLAALTLDRALSNIQEPWDSKRGRFVFCERVHWRYESSPDLLCPGPTQLLRSLLSSSVLASASQVQLAYLVARMGYTRWKILGISFTMISFCLPVSDPQGQLFSDLYWEYCGVPEDKAHDVWRLRLQPQVVYHLHYPTHSFQKFMKITI